MWSEVVFVITLLSIQSTSAFTDCDGSATNVDGLLPAPQKNKAGFAEFPWVVALYKKDAAQPHCAGAIIDDSTIITTAFCVKKFTNPSDLIIRAGMWDLNRTNIEDHQMQQRVAKTISSHPDYSSPDPIENDIAVVHVNQPFQFGKNIQKVCLDTGSQKVATNGPCFGTAWGAVSESGELSQYLKKIKMDRVDHSTCEKKLRIALAKEAFNLSQNFLCAGGKDADLCVGDSGAPFVCAVGGDNQYVLTGLASYGVKCFTDTPGVYTNVAKYVEWIHQQSE